MPQDTILSKPWVHVATVLLMITAAACGPSQKQANEDNSKANSAATASNSTARVASTPDPGVDMNCVIDHIQNPPEAFHYSYKKTGDNLVDEEADITPQAIDGSFTNNSGTGPVHGVKADQSSWQGAWTGLMGISGMSSTIALVKNSTSMQRVGPENVNGYDATKYSVDTTQATVEEAGLYKSTLGDGGFEKGTIWVTSQGCPVKISLDSEMHLKNGDVDKVHYEESMTKK